MTTKKSESNIHHNTAGKKILITGGTGLVGRYLSKLLIEKAYEVALLSRRTSTSQSIPSYYCNYKENKVDIEALCSADIIIHLAGANIAEKRWTAARKKEILDSRVKTTELIYNTLKENKNNLQTFISASAVGYYGAITSNNIFTEKDDAYDDFLGNVCKDWEKSADLFENIGVRTVKMRTGLVLSQNEGALEKINASFKFRSKVVLGSGRQYMPWVHIHDLCNMYIKAVEDNEMKGVFNSVSGDYHTYSSFVNELAKLSKKPFINFKIPAFVLKIILGNMSDLLLEGSRISSEKIINEGFKFKYYDLQTALKSCIN